MVERVRAKSTSAIGIFFVKHISTRRSRGPMRTKPLAVATGIACAASMAGCGSSVDPDIRFTATSISANPVPAPSADAPSTLTISATVDADPKVGSVGLLIGRRDPSIKTSQIPLPVAAFSFPCTQPDASGRCGASSYLLNCRVSIVPGASAQRRSLACDGSTNATATAEFDAGEYDYEFAANTPGGDFFGTDYDYVRGTIRFD
jgi:hypothetical protein